MENTFYPTIQIRKQKSRKFRLIRFWLVVFIGIVIMAFVVTNLFSKKSEVADFISPLGSVKPFNIATGGSVKSAAITPLGKLVQDQLVGTNGTYAVAIKNLKTGESYYSNEHLSFQSGSLYKLWIMAVAFKQIKDGQLKPDQVFSEDIDTLNQKFDIDPEDAELTDGTITMSVSTALNQMITISHNYAAMLLTEHERLSNVADYLEEQGFNESKVGVNGDAPTTTAADIEKFLEKLYSGTLADTDSNAQMLALLKNQKLNNKLPKNLPDGVVIAHKTGELGTFSHDAGIVYTPEGDYIIVVLTDTAIPSAAEDRIAGISQAVYSYFTQGR